MLRRYKYFNISLLIWIVCKTILKMYSHVTAVGNNQTSTSDNLPLFSTTYLAIKCERKKLEPLFHIFFNSESFLFPFKI